jgi:uncharacterized protein (TIGR04141 family)
MARKPKERHFDLSIYLIKAGVTDHEVIVPSSPKLDESRVRNGRHTVGTLYVSYPPKGKLPKWTDFVRGGVADEFLDALKVKTASGVLLVEQDDRVFAITFGHGHHLIDNEQIVSDFGLKTTLNSVDPDAIRQVDRRKLDSTGRIAIEQSGIEIPIYQFGLDIEQDLVRRVTAKPRDPELGRQLSGKDALRVTAPLNLENLNAFLSKIYRISQETTYRDNFAFIDNIAEIREEGLILALQGRVIELANDDGASDVWMAPPDIIDWNLTQGMRYTDDSDEELRQDIDLVTFGAVAMGGDPITWDGLEHHRIHVIDNDDNELESWPARKCLYAEFEHDGHTYVLTEGKWYRINDDFATRVAQNFAAIPDCGLHLPVWTQRNEGQYNDDTAAASGGNLRLLDRQLINFPPGRDRMEFCDLLSNQRHLIHVKQFSSSSGMSHLCSQAANSAEYLKMDSRFRELVNQKLTDLGIPQAFHVPAQFTNENAGQYEVVFGIAGKHAHLPIEIPFFSKVSISHAARRCQGLGFRVSKLKIVKDNLAD